VKKLLSRLIAAAGAISVLLALNPGVAYAASDAAADCGDTWDSVDQLYSNACWGYFESEVGDGTERLTIKDTSHDGHSVVVVNYRYDLENIGPYYGQLDDGYGSYKTWTLHMPEGTEIRFKVCAAEGGSILSDTCSSYVTGVA
jgi:hypothetical protein